MKSKSATRRFFPLSSIVLAGASLLASGIAFAQTNYTSYTNNSNLTLASGDTLTVSSGDVDISYGGSGTGLARTLDASLAASVTFEIGSLRIGTRSDPLSTSTSDRLGTLNLGANNTITASTIVSIGGGGHIVSGVLTTAANSTTVINTPVMDIGTALRTSTPNPNLTIGADSSLTIQGISGGRTALTVGEERQASGGINWGSSGIMDLSGGQATLKLSSLIVGNSVFDSGENGSGTGSLTMSSNAANQLDISGAGTVVQVGASDGNQATGTLTIGSLGSNSTITSTNNSTAILIGNRTTDTGDTVTGTVNLNGGTVTITTTGTAIAGGSNATSNLNLAGGVTLKAGASSSNWIQNLDTAVINSGGAVIDTNTFDLGISQAFSGGGGLTKNGAGTLTLSGTSTYTGATNVSAGTLLVNGALGITAVTVDPNGTIGGSGTLAGPLTFNVGGNLDLTGASLGETSTGILTVSGTQAITLSSFAFADIIGWNAADADAGIYTLINGGSSVTLSGTTPTQLNPYDFGNGKFGYFTQGSLQAVIIPEPSAALLGGLGMLVLLRRRRGA